jgi:hypothetical protein
MTEVNAQYSTIGTSGDDNGEKYLCKCVQYNAIRYSVNKTGNKQRWAMMG